MIVELTTEDALAVLRRGRTASLGCLVDGWPYVVPVNYTFDGAFVYLHSLPGRKIDGIRVNPRVCLQVSEIQSEHHWRSVQVFGPCRQIADPEQAERIFSLLFTRFPRLTPADSVRRFGHLEHATMALEIGIDRVVGVGEGVEAPE
jgi:nitroimidazol reductase NimA-like FMN-containing flavoprotein (pyridoxamine 5'-phosphate oxidase superfamily)